MELRIHLIAALALLAVPASAQFENLSTTNAGDAIYFSTVLRPRGSSDLPYPKLYRLDPDGIHLVAQTPYPQRSVETGGWIVEGASLSGDGHVVAVNSSSPCYFGTPCVEITQEFSLIQIAGVEKRYKGRAQISRGGRYAMLDRRSGFGFMPDPTDLPRQGLSRLDLATGAITLLGQKPAIAGDWIAADGTILVIKGNNEWRLIMPSGDETSLGPAPTAARAILAGDASFVLYQVGITPSSTPQPAMSEIRIRERDGTDRSVTPNGVAAGITADSRYLLMLIPVQDKLQAFLQQRGGNPMFQASTEPEGLTQAIISGDGRRIIATTATGRIVSISTLTGQSTQLIGPTPKLEPFPRAMYGDLDPIQDARVPGSTYSIRGEHLAPEDETPRVLVAGQPAALYSVTPTEILYQVAWETPTSEQPVEVVLESDDPNWEAVIAVESISAFSPAPIALANDTALSPSGKPAVFPVYAVHGDWHGLVTQNDPARPGEYVSGYLTGLGPVNPSLATGQPGPSNPPAQITRQCIWSAYSSGNHGEWTPRAEVIFTGMAPALIGFYQVTLKIPDDTPTGFYSLSCEFTTDDRLSVLPVVPLINVQRP